MLIQLQIMVDAIALLIKEYSKNDDEMYNNYCDLFATIGSYLSEYHKDIAKDLLDAIIEDKENFFKALCETRKQLDKE